MAEVMPQQTTSPPRKRTHDGEFVHHDTLTPDSNPSTNTTSRHASPAPSTAISELTELTSSISSPGAAKISTLQSDATSENGTPAKKRKLTFAEREVEKAVKKREREEKEKAKAEERQRKEEEKRQKDEEKRQKEEEKEAARRTKELEKAEKKKLDDAKKAEREEKKKVKDAERQEKEAEKAKKDAEKAQKEAEKQKKEKAQLRIGSFFAKPASTSTPPLTPDNVSVGVSSRRSSVASVRMEESIVQVEAGEPTNPDFDKYIIPYFVHEHTEIAPTNRFKVMRSSLFGGRSSDYEIETTSNIEPLQNRFRKSFRRLRSTTTVKQIMESTQGDSEEPSTKSPLIGRLQYIPIKILSFREDIRPPYIGTYSTIIPPRSQRKMSRKPTFKGRPDTNYDYDSEAEWEPPADDDDEINLEDELSESEGEEDEMQDFLDDEDDTARRKLFIGEMEPVSSGLCWQDDPSSKNVFNMEDYRMDVLHDATSFPIDPFSTVHWTDTTKASSTQVKTESKTKDGPPVKDGSDGNSMPPPRLPLAAVNAPNTILSYASKSGTQPLTPNENSSPMAKQRGRPAQPNKELKMISDEFLPSFKEAVAGSDLTKAGLIEILKKQFPKCSKDAIKDTLGVIAIRVGKKEADKKWELV